jgi:two-component system, chemotaxis family, CheB/CheR fusion protein
VGNLIYDLNNHEWDIPDLRKLLETVLNESFEIKDHVVNHEFKNIGNKTLNLNLRSLDVADQKPMLLISIKDITEHKKTEEKLVESKEKLNTLFENLSVGISIIDHERRVIYENPALEKILGLSKAELKLGKYAERRYFNLITLKCP